MEPLSSYVWHGTDGESPLHDTKDLLRLLPGEQETDSSSVTILTFTGAGALYRGLQYIELTDGRSIINVNRDDAAGFRLDTLATNKQYAAPAVRGSDVLTTHTDYVNRYRSVLQTTSYNFTGTTTTLEYCAGVVKAQPLFSKSPAQHAADFEMLQGEEELKKVFLQPNGDRKPILCTSRWCQ